MGMRIATKMIYNMAMNNIRNNLTRLTKCQNRLATQKNIQTISDDPIGAGRIMDYANKLNQISQFERNINRAENLSSIYDTTLQQVVGNMLRVKEIAVAAANDVGLNTTQREAYASELQQIKLQMLNAANTRLGDKYIFSGFKDKVQTFSMPTADIIPDGGNTGTSTAEMLVEDLSSINGDSYQITFVDASTIDVVNVTTGENLYDDIAYVSGESIEFGSFSVKITSDPGPPAAGDIFDITTDIGCAFNGDSNLLRVEIEEGNIVPINLTGDTVFLGQGLTDGINMFTMMDDLIEDVLNGNSIEVSNALEGIDAVRDQVLNHIVTIGTRENLYDVVRIRLGEYQYAFEVLRSQIEDVEVDQAVTELSKAQLAYEAALVATDRLANISFLEFLR